MKYKLKHSVFIVAAVFFMSLFKAPVGYTAPPSADNADTVDFFHASAAALANTLFALDDNAKFPNSVLYTGSGNGLDADMVDGLHADSFIQQGQADVVDNVMLMDNSVTDSKIVDFTDVLTANIDLDLMQSSGVTDVEYTFGVPYSYAGGPLKVREYYLTHDAAGTAVIERFTHRLGFDGLIESLELNEPFNFVDPVGGWNYRSWTIPDGWVRPGDMIKVRLRRYGDDAADTMGRLEILGVAVDYTTSQ